MIVIVLIALVAVAVAVLVMKNPGTKKKEEKVIDDSSSSHIKMEPSTSSTIHFSDEFKSTEPVTTKYDNHEVKTILMIKNDSTIWVCPYCETENRMSMNKCCVCHNAR